MSRSFRCSQNFNFLSRFYRQGKLQQQQQQYKKDFSTFKSTKIIIGARGEMGFSSCIFSFFFLNAYLLWVRLMAS